MNPHSMRATVMALPHAEVLKTVLKEVLNSNSMFNSAPQPRKAETFRRHSERKMFRKQIVRAGRDVP